MAPSMRADRGESEVKEVNEVKELEDSEAVAELS